MGGPEWRRHNDYFSIQTKEKAASILLWLADSVPVGGIQVVRLDFWNGREQTLLVDDVLRKAIGRKAPIRAAAAQ